MQWTARQLMPGRLWVLARERIRLRCVAKPHVARCCTSLNVVHVQPRRRRRLSLHQHLPTDLDASTAVASTLATHPSRLQFVWTPRTATRTRYPDRTPAANDTRCPGGGTAHVMAARKLQQEIDKVRPSNCAVM